MNNLTDKKLGFFDRLLRRIETIPASDRFLLRIVFFLIIATGLSLAFAVNQQFSAATATRGGTISEGVLGTPRFVNPALAITRADQDITMLIYSGLLKIDTEGNLVPDATESITVSDDGLTYNIILREDVTFHDDTPLTAKDVAYTIHLIQDPDLKSPLRGNWSDVSVEEIGDYELNVVLEEPYAPFIENFTVGIMPAHLWNNLPIEQLPFSQLNTEPIGSGPFRIEQARRDESGLIESYLLTANREHSDSPKVNNVELHFFAKESDIITALQDDAIDASAYISTENLSLIPAEKFEILEKPLPRVFGIFFNQNKSDSLRDAKVREALSLWLDRDTLIKTALSGRGVPIEKPVILPANELESRDGTEVVASSTPQDQALALLEEAGWERNDVGHLEKSTTAGTEPLKITLRTSNAPLFESILREVATQWEALGVEVVTEQFEQTGLVQSVIRPRDFEALLFGLDMSRSHDLYPFWHSSQKDDPGLNIAQYANVSVDKLLETARTEQDNTARLEALYEANDTIAKEFPAVFLFQPTMVYVVGKDITLMPIERPGKPSDRFSNVSEWHTKSDVLWPIFRRNLHE
ncbi:MAG: peptide ABC transporter substrate-binding protein [Patescibacteria group bacterium]